MTENIFTAEAAAAETSKRPLVLVAGLVGALVLGGSGYFLLSGGSPSASAPVVFRPAPHSAKPAVAKSTAAKPKAAKLLTVLPASTTPLGRDPFKALYLVPAAATAPAGGTPAAGAPPATGGTTAPTTGTPATGGSAPAATPAYALQLKSIDSSQPQFRRFSLGVAGQNKTVIQGQKFGKYGELVVLAVLMDGRGKVIGALIQVGDGNPFGVRIGEKVSVA